jgi:hypothetical protein
MSRRGSRLPKGARTAAWILRFLGAGGSGTLLIVCLLVAFTPIGSKYVSTASGQTACELPDSVGGPGVEVFGDLTLLGLAHALPDSLAGGTVVDDVKAGRTAQQARMSSTTYPTRPRASSSRNGAARAAHRRRGNHQTGTGD